MRDENVSYESDWYIVPSYIRKLPGMTLGYLDVYEVVFQFLNKGRQCFLSNEAISKRTGFKPRYIRKALDYFEGLHELKRVTHEKKRYIVIPEKRIQIEKDEHEQAVDKPVIKPSKVALQCHKGGTTVPGGAALQCRDKSKPTALKALVDKGCSKLSFSLNKESLNKEFNDHDYYIKPMKAKKGVHVSREDGYMFEKLVNIGMIDGLALKLITKHSAAELNNIIEYAQSHNIENIGAYVNASLSNPRGEKKWSS